MQHTPVLLHESVDLLAIKQGDVVVDGTLGAGGHSELMCQTFGRNITLIGIDTDEDALERSKTRLDALGCTLKYAHANFRDIDKVLKDIGIAQVDKLLLDLGVSSHQIDDSGRGFSFLRNEPLRMTLHRTAENDLVTAYDVVNSWSEETLREILKGYGEERYARSIARGICQSREQQPIRTTFDLVDIINHSVPALYRHGRLHPATRTFQAIRIAVNDELETLKTAMDKGFDLLSPNGRIAIISFHSLEDRLVKRFYKEKKEAGLATLITKKPIIPTDTEIAHNSRSRSAKLRVIQKI